MANSPNVNFVNEDEQSNNESRNYIVPKDIKDDIVYCQRNLRNFLKVHKLVTDVFKNQADADPVKKQNILEELENEIEEINAEQQYVFLLLQDSVENFFTLLTATENRIIRPERRIINMIVSNTIVPLINKDNYIITPTHVQVRATEDDLIRRHFLISERDADLSTISSPSMPIDEIDANQAPIIVWDSSSAGFDNGQVVENEIEIETECVVTPESSKRFKLSTENNATECRNDADDNNIQIVIVSDDEEDAIAAGTAPDITREVERNSARVCAYKQTVTQKSDTPAVEQQGLLSSPPALAPLSMASRNIAIFLPKPAKQEGVSENTDSDTNIRTSLKRSRKTKQKPRVFDDDDDVLLIMSPETAKDKVSETKVPLPLLVPISNSVAVPNLNIILESGQSVKRNEEAKTATISKKINNFTSVRPANPIKIKGSSTKIDAEGVENTIIKKQTKKCDKKVSVNKNKKTKKDSSITFGFVDNTDCDFTDVKVGKSVEINSSTDNNSSDDSHSLVQTRGNGKIEINWEHTFKDYRTRVPQPDNDKELFMAMIGLYTPAVVAQLQQRRSKRKRRSVHAVSHPDFHYESLTNHEQRSLSVAEETKKRKKSKTEFLLSSKTRKRYQATKKLFKRPTPEKPVNLTTNRNKFKIINSSRVSSERNCCMCKKSNEPIYPCNICTSMFHQECHEDKGKPNLHVVCPICLYKNELIPKTG